MRRAFLVPVGLALAALGSRASAGGSTVAQATLEPDGSHVAPAAVRQPLLAISRARRGLAGVLAHSSHASHASHASHFSSSTPAPPAPTPVATQTTRFAATLNAAQEVPSVADRGIGAKGRFTATLQGRMLHWRLTFADLSSGERAVALHIGAPGAVGPSFASIAHVVHSPATGTVVLTPTQVSDLLRDKTYINLGTASYPHGEIRGRIARATAAAAPPSGGGGVGHVSHASHASHASHSSHFSSG